MDRVRVVDTVEISHWSEFGTTTRPCVVLTLPCSIKGAYAESQVENQARTVSIHERIVSWEESQEQDSGVETVVEGDGCLGMNPVAVREAISCARDSGHGDEGGGGAGRCGGSHPYRERVCASKVRK
eukprot:688514-Pleurochrysis_carterae.AAC.1